MSRPGRRRQLEAALLAARGLTNKEIAREMTISESTVRMYMEHAIRDADVRNRVQLAVKLTLQGLVNV